ERHVFEKMRDAVDLGRLVPVADIDPETERDRIDRLDPVGDDAQPVRKRGERYRHAAPRFGRARRAWVRRKPATAATSLDRTVMRSRLSMMSASAAGTGGRTPMGRATAPGNFSGSACARALVG